MTRYSLVILAFALLYTAPILANSVLPDTIPGTRTVNAEELIEVVWENQSIVLIDSRFEADRKQGYIEGSINLPDTSTDCEALKGISPDMAQPIIFYCNGPECERSSHAVKIAQTCGYHTLYWFRGGFEEWKKKQYPFIR